MRIRGLSFVIKKGRSLDNKMTPGECILFPIKRLSHELQPARMGELREPDWVTRNGKKQPGRENSKELTPFLCGFFAVFAQFVSSLSSICPVVAVFE
jgi:hypothetical protein